MAEGAKERIYICPVSGIRLDIFLSEVSGFTRSHIKSLIEDGRIFFYPCKGGKHNAVHAPIHGGAAEGSGGRMLYSSVPAPAHEADGYGIAPKAFKSGTMLKTGDKVVMEIPPDKPLALVPENIDIGIVYEDEHLAVIDKPQGLTVHPGGGADSGTLVNALLYRLKTLSSINGAIRPGIVHRLDKMTSGLLVIAKTDVAHVGLARQIAEKTAVRIYRALLEGVVKEDGGTIDKPVGRDIKDRKKMAVSYTGRKAVTHFKVLKRFERYTYAEFRLETGRTHQIRVHAKFMGHPVVGDTVYGYREQKFKLKGQLLHAAELSFTHPVTGQAMTFQSGLPDYFVDVLKKLC